MKRFNGVNLIEETNRLINYIFERVELAKKDDITGFRELKYGSIPCEFFTFVFLCGGNKNEFATRDVLLNDVFNTNNNKHLKIIISEKLEECKGNVDLLTFETILEAMSKMILIPVESFGTACELGAFTRIDKENNKVVAILDVNKKGNKSFINYGPVSFLKDIGSDRVYYTKYKTVGKRKTILLTSDLCKLYEHSLIKSDITIKKYYSINDNVITDLSSFFIAILDLACLMGVVNADIVLNFFKKRFNVERFGLETKTIKYEFEQIPEIINVFLRVLESMDFLDEDKKLFYVKPKELIGDVSNDERWIGKVLFDNAFTRTDEYLQIKAECLKFRENLKRYGYF